MANEKLYVTVNYDGKMFTWNKEQIGSDYEKHESSTGKIGYRKYFNKGVEGKLNYFTFKKNQFKNDAEELHVSLGDYMVVFNVMDTSGDGIDPFLESFLRSVPKLEKGMVYNINNWKMNKGDVVKGAVVTNTMRGVTVRCGETKLEPALSYQSDNNPNGDIPRLEWKEKAGKNRPTAVSKEAKLDYLYDTLLKQVERLKYEDNGNSSTTPASNPAPQPTAANIPAPTEDLPF
jgi:hypothetical protein